MSDERRAALLYASQFAEFQQHMFIGIQHRQHFAACEQVAPTFDLQTRAFLFRNRDLLVAFPQP
jgi:3-deoxy-D-manno-octulosonic acid (KDO) 8-phosphate synthase